MSKLTNKELQAVKKNLYTVHTFDGEGSRSCTISGCNIVRAMEETGRSLTLIYPNELDGARLPREAFSGIKFREVRDHLHPVWYWVLEVEAAAKRRATWQEVQRLYELAKEWLLDNRKEDGDNE